MFLLEALILMKLSVANPTYLVDNSKISCISSTDYLQFLCQNRLHSYLNKSKNLSFKYPDQWTISDDINAPEEVIVNMGKVKSKIDIPSRIFIFFQNKSVKSPLEQAKVIEELGLDKLPKESFTINGKRTLKIIDNRLSKLAVESTYYTVHLLVFNNKEYMHITAPILLDPDYDVFTEILLKSLSW